MTAAIEARGLGKQYGRRWALTDCTLTVPAGHVVGLVGPNGAGKTTLLNLATGMLEPTTGTIEVLGGRPASSPAQLARVGYVAQDTPTYAGLSVADHLRFGAHMNPGWDAALAQQPDRAARPGPGAEGRQAIGRPARSARADAGHRQAPGAADPGRADREPGPARPARVPADPDGGDRRAGAERRDVLAPGGGSGAGRGLPDRAGGLARASGRRDRRPAGQPPAADRAARGCERAAARRGGDHREPHRPAEHVPGAQHRAGRTTRPGRPTPSTWRTWCSPTWARPPASARPALEEIR